MGTPAERQLAQEFVQFAVQAGVLRFGEFKTKAGRLSPYFFNAGLFNNGASLGRLAEFYARRLLLGSDGGLPFDMLFGPAYKGITLASALAVELARRGHHVPFAYNRKEAKDHGEGGSVVGAALAGRVLIVDDVMSAGTSVRESIALIAATGATPCGVAIALDRQERTADERPQDDASPRPPAADVASTGRAVSTQGQHGAPWSAVQYVTGQLGLAVASIATLQDLLQYLRASDDAALCAFAAPVQAYRERYGV